MSLSENLISDMEIKLYSIDYNIVNLPLENTPYYDFLIYQKILVSIDMRNITSSYLAEKMPELRFYRNILLSWIL